ncbi:MAG TPA: hypothetical protein VIY47_14000, partial [Ignavibacteriaceae bacterium]
QKKLNPYDLVGLYGESDSYAVRWADGIVTVYDETMYPHLEQILEFLNNDLNDVRLVKTHVPDKAHIKIKKGQTQDACGLTTLWTNRLNRTISSAEVIMSEKMSTGACQGDTQGYAAYLHELTHAVGFSRHMQDGDAIMDKNVNMSASVRIPAEYHWFLRALYSIPAGINIPDWTDELKEDHFDNVALLSVLPGAITNQPSFSIDHQGEKYKSRPGVELAKEDTDKNSIPTEEIKSQKEIVTIDASKENQLLPMPEQAPLKMAKKEQKLKTSQEKRNQQPSIETPRIVQQTQEKPGLVFVSKYNKKERLPIVEFKPGVEMASTEKNNAPGFFWDKSTKIKNQNKPIF